MKRLLTSAAAALALSGAFAVPAFADDHHGKYGYERDNRDWDHDRGRHDRDGRYDRDSRYDRNGRTTVNVQVNVSPYHDNRTEWRDTRRNVVWNDRDYNGYYVGDRFFYGRPTAAAYRDRDFCLGYRPLQSGGRIAYDNSYYREVDYRDYRVAQPRAGYHWVEDDKGDLILAALVGGLIATVIANN
jgi:Ni/Co efflux regulator RcnB